MKSAWKGPYEEGVTQSLIGKFLECPYRAYLYLILGLEEDTELEPNLIWGDTFHKGSEILIREDKLIEDISDEEWLLIETILREHLNTKFINVPITYKYSIPRMLRLYNDSYKNHNKYWTEIPFEFPYINGVKLRGKLDGLSHNLEIMVEHKCKGKIDSEQTRAETKDDLQVNMYSLVTGATKVIYDLIRIPDNQFFMPQRKHMQTIEQYVNRWYAGEHTSQSDYPINSKKPSWITQDHIPIDKEYQKDYIKKTLNPLIERIEKWWEHVNQPNFDADNPDYYNHIFYKTPIRHFDPGKTERYKCSYWNFLTGKITIDELKPVKGFYEELKSEQLQSYSSGLSTSRGSSQIIPECLPFSIRRIN